MATFIQPIGAGVALTTASIQVIGQNPTRQALWFHNRGSVNNIEIAPAPIVAGSAGSIVIMPGAMVQFNFPQAATCAWNAHMVASTGDLSILEWPA
jgi:hypothetical protein